MKKIQILFTTLILTMLFSVSTVAQEKNSFAGKWEVLVRNTPRGDAKMILTINEKEHKLSGSVTDVATGNVTQLDKVEVKPTNVIVYFMSSGYDVNINLEKKDEDNLFGKTMDMFDTTAKRLK